MLKFTVLSSTEKPKSEITHLLKAERTRALDGTDTLELMVENTNVTKNDRIIYTDCNDTYEYIVQSVEEERSENVPLVTINAANSVCELVNSYIVYDPRHDTTAIERAQTAVDGTRWELETVENGTLSHRANLSFYHINALDALMKVCKVFGLELVTHIVVEDGVITHRKISLLERRGNRIASKRFEYGRDLKNVKRVIDPAQVITKLYVWGKGVERDYDKEKAEIEKKESKLEGGSDE